MRIRKTGEFTALVGKRIAERRRAKGMRQVDLGAKIGLSKTAMIRLENGKANITLEQLVGMAKELAPIEELLGLPHYDDAEMADFVQKRVLAMTEEELRDWKQNTEPAATDHRRIYILDCGAEQAKDGD